MNEQTKQRQSKQILSGKDKWQGNNETRAMCMEITILLNNETKANIKYVSTERDPVLCAVARLLCFLNLFVALHWISFLICVRKVHFLLYTVSYMVTFLFLSFLSVSGKIVSVFVRMQCTYRKQLNPWTWLQSTSDKRLSPWKN